MFVDFRYAIEEAKRFENDSITVISSRHQIVILFTCYEYSNYFYKFNSNQYRYTTLGIERKYIRKFISTAHRDRCAPNMFLCLRRNKKQKYNPKPACLKYGFLHVQCFNRRV